jgi:hypothetical protein
MKIIEMLEEQQFKAIVNAGEQLAADLKGILSTTGLEIETGPAVLAVAAAGIALALGISPSTFIELFQQCSTAWRIEGKTAAGQNALIFDPGLLKDTGASLDMLD